MFGSAPSPRSAAKGSQKTFHSACLFATDGSVVVGSRFPGTFRAPPIHAMRAIPVASSGRFSSTSVRGVKPVVSRMVRGVLVETAVSRNPINRSSPEGGGVGAFEVNEARLGIAARRTQSAR
jgi:hypothetical protein